ncbi:MAG TPA: LCP family protein [Acidimicrobiales bacterium]|nr:LCP family protein [Acidimicrobiales bacterium]
MSSHFRRGVGPQRLRVAVVAAIAVVLVGFGIVKATPHHRALVVGKYEGSTTTSPTVTVPAPDIGRAPIPAPKGGSDLLGANGSAYGRALAFHSTIPIKDGLRFMLIVGSDARPGQDLRHTRTDSLHVVAVDPATHSGTIVGIPRDTYVDIPGHGQHKINEAMELGGPSLMMETIRNFTGLPVEYYVLTGFEGFSQMVDELGGVDVNVPRNMNDNYSGAHFAAGYHHFNGEQALAFCRDRHDVAYGDFTRSENQGLLMLATLAKLRAETTDDAGLRRWLSVLAEHAEFDASMSEMESLAALVRRIDPSWLQNVVMPGKTGTASGGQSVVYPTEAAAAVWGDLRDDARLTNAPTGSDNTEDTTATTVEEPTTDTTDTTTTTQPPLISHGGGGDTTTTAP